eukprot:2660301-Pleurochrysis_carterae.AAC.1
MCEGSKHARRSAKPDRFVSAIWRQKPWFRAKPEAARPGSPADFNVWARAAVLSAVGAAQTLQARRSASIRQRGVVAV